MNPEQATSRRSVSTSLEHDRLALSRRVRRLAERQQIFASHPPADPVARRALQVELREEESALREQTAALAGACRRLAE